jgi:hypothetical protein
LNGFFSVWEGLLEVNGKVGGAHCRLTSDLSYLFTEDVGEMRTELLTSAKAKDHQEFQAL